ncbi:hypothetical protein [Pectinatus sottacetonis]|uniref:hypothetical protein n=1 Tax=Pectinatus sottacetonis TaxID=1002795 RepID=UPI0018C49252|nr:hypothetical protein [Pectinatus sottacetonis]
MIRRLKRLAEKVTSFMEMLAKKAAYSSGKIKIILLGRNKDENTGVYKASSRYE